MIKALRLMSYANRPPRTPILQGDRRVRKSNQTIKVMINFLIEIRLNGESETENRHKRQRGKGTYKTDSFSHGLSPISQSNHHR